MRIVRATGRDADLCFAIARSAAVAGFRDVFPPGVHDFPDAAIHADWVAALGDPDGETYIAVDGKGAAGVVSVSDGIIQTLYVRPESWSRGVGSALHDHALKRLRKTGVRDARLWTLEQNHRARRFYENRGWTLTGGTRVVPYPPHPIDVEYARPVG